MISKIIFVLIPPMLVGCSAMTEGKLNTPRRMWVPPCDPPHCVAALFPVRESTMAGDATLLLIATAAEMDIDNPSRASFMIIGAVPAHESATSVLWIDCDNGGQSNDCIIVTKRGATGYRNVHVWRSITHGGLMTECLSDGSRHIPYYGDVDGDGYVELFLSTDSAVVDANDEVVAETYRRFEFTDQGFILIGTVTENDLPDGIAQMTIN